MAKRSTNAPREPNTAELRAAIPSGRTPTIDSAHEPSAASFDTDDEAAGRPAQAAAIKQALAHEGRVDAQPPRAARHASPAPLWIALAVTAAAVLAWIVLS
jgi:hypothetical protein